MDRTLSKSSAQNIFRLIELINVNFDFFISIQT